MAQPPEILRENSRESDFICRRPQNTWTFSARHSKIKYSQYPFRVAICKKITSRQRISYVSAPPQHVGSRPATPQSDISSSRSDLYHIKNDLNLASNKTREPRDDQDASPINNKSPRRCEHCSFVPQNASNADWIYAKSIWVINGITVPRRKTRQETLFA